MLAAAAFFSSESLGQSLPRAAESPHWDIEGCPTAVEWLDALRARLPPELHEHPALRATRVTLRRTVAGAESRFEGELGAGGEPLASRTLRGSDCAEVADALTLVASLEIQRVAHRSAPAPSALQPANAPAVQPADSPLRYREGARGSRRLGVVGFALLQSVTAPRWGTDVGLGVSVEWQTRVWQPWLMLGGYWGSDSEPIGSGSAEARFERWATLFVACPLSYSFAASVVLRPCANLDVGSISGSGRGVGAAAQSVALFASAGLEARMEWRISEHLQVGGLLGGVLPLSRPRFFLEPDYTALSVPALGLRTGASASLSF